VKVVIFALLLSLSGYVAAEDTVPANPRFSVYGATVVDEQTGLRWKRCSVGQTWLPDNTCRGKPKQFNFLQAQKQTNFSPQADGFWRVPTKNEIATLVDPTKRNLKIDTFLFPDVNDSNRFYWTCDLYDDGAAWYVDFHDGYVGYMSGDHSSADDHLAVRLVHVER